MARLSGPTAAPDPAMARDNAEFVRARLRREFPLHAQAVESIVSAGRPLGEALRDVARLRARRARSRAGR